MQVASSAADAEAAAPHTTPRDGDADLHDIDEEDVLDQIRRDSDDDEGEENELSAWLHCVFAGWYDGIQLGMWHQIRT